MRVRAAYYLFIEFINDFTEKALHSRNGMCANTKK